MIVDLPRVPDGRAGAYNRAGLLGRGWGHKQINVNNARSGGQVVRSLLGSLGGISCGKLYIVGVTGYVTPIWDVFVPQGEWEEAGERLCGAKLINFFPIRKAVPVGLARARFCCWARWARFFMFKNMYITSYSIFSHNIPFINIGGCSNR